MLVALKFNFYVEKTGMIVKILSFKNCLLLKKYGNELFEIFIPIISFYTFDKINK